MKHKKAQAIEQMQNLIIPLIGIGIVLVIGFLIMAEAGSQAVSTASAQNLTNCTSFACNGTKETISAMAGIPGWLPIIVITVIGAILIGLVAMFRR